MQRKQAWTECFKCVGFSQRSWNSTELMMLLRAPRWALEILLKSQKKNRWVYTGLVVSMFSLLWWYIIKIKHAVNSPNLWKLNEKIKFLRIFKEISRSILESKKASLIRLNFTFVEKTNTLDAPHWILFSTHLIPCWTCKLKVAKSIGFS